MLPYKHFQAKLILKQDAIEWRLQENCRWRGQTVEARATETVESQSQDVSRRGEGLCCRSPTTTTAVTKAFTWMPSTGWPATTFEQRLCSKQKHYRRVIAVGRTFTLSVSVVKRPQSTRSLSNQNLHPFFPFLFSIPGLLQIDSDSHLFDHHPFLFLLHYSQACITQFTLQQHGIYLPKFDRKNCCSFCTEKFFSQAIKFCC